VVQARDHTPIIIDRAGGEEIRIIALPAISGCLAAEPHRGGQIPKQEAEFLREITGSRRAR
jgi:hypothetical protein